MAFEVETRLLRYVITVSEEGNITRAARKRLYIAAPSLAREIRMLETRLGYKLFNRHWRGVSLTPAGTVFVDEARKARMHMLRAAERGAAASRGDTSAMIIGHTPFLETERLIQLRQRLAEEFPSVTVEFRSTFSVPLLELVLSGTVQAGLVVLPMEAEDLRSECIWKHHLVAAFPEGSPLAASPAVSLRDLSGTPAVWPVKSLNPGFYDWMLRSCHRAGYVPRIVHEVSTCDELLDAVGNGIGFGFIKQSISLRLQMKGVVFRELVKPGLVVQTGVVYRTDTSSHSLKALLRVLKDLPNCEAEVSDSSPLPLPG